MGRRTIAVGFAIAMTVNCAQAQWLVHRDAKTPRMPDGRPNLSAPVPRLNGKPDLSGVWREERTPRSEFVRVLGEDLPMVQVDLNDVTKHTINVFWDVKPGDEPMRPETAALVEQRLSSGEDWQTSYCLPESLPAALTVTEFKLIQTPEQLAALFGNISPPRQIYTDGRSLPEDPQPSWMGYSVGKWDGDTLVVETIGITDRAWLDAFGHPRSEAMRITERYRRRDFGHMDLEMVFDDPANYTKPFSIRIPLELMPDTDILEYVCNENAKNLSRTTN